MTREELISFGEMFLEANPASKNTDTYKFVEKALELAKQEPLTPDTLADLLMEERIRGELKQDITYCKDIINDVRCKLTVEIIDHRPCYCGAGLREIWRDEHEENIN
jgi:hypothetical protein